MKIFNSKTINYKLNKSEMNEFVWHTSDNLSSIAGAKDMIFNVRCLDIDKYSYPYHFHRNSEEMMIMLEGQALLRTPDGIKEVSAGEMIFFEEGASGAHQLYNHTKSPCKYIDIRTDRGMDVCEYPDSGKINILPESEIHMQENIVSYFDGEENVKKIWDDLLKK